MEILGPGVAWRPQVLRLQWKARLGFFGFCEKS